MATEQDKVLLWEDFFPASSQTELRHIYGTYIEMAFHNYFVTMNHIYTKVFGRDIIDVAKNEILPEVPRYNPNQEIDFSDAKIWNKIYDDFKDATPEAKLRIHEYMYQHFPFLVPLFTPTREKNKETDAYDSETQRLIDTKLNQQVKVERLSEEMQKLTNILRVLRNYYAHYSIKLNSGQQNTLIDNINQLFYFLENVYNGSKRIVKTRFSFSESDMRCAQRLGVTKDSPKDDKGHSIPTERKGFRYQLWHKNASGQKCFTPFGILLFTSLFLEKKYSKIFADKIHFITKQDEKVICEMLSVYRLRLHVKSLSVEKNTDAIALDILNELRKCPIELFELLRPKDQRKFRTNPDEEDISSNEILMVRKSDRFPSLLMKYIDDANLFQDIRFQVSLGKYFYKFYNKHCIGNDHTTRVRSLSKDIHGFGRLSEIEETRKAIWAGLIREYEDVHQNTADDKPYITDHRASYIFNANRIGLYIRKSADEPSTYIPELKPNGASNMPPTCWMSTYELPAMAFLMLLRSSSEVESIIKQNITDYKKLFSDIRDGIFAPQASKEEIQNVLSKKYGNIQLSGLPKNMQDYLLCKDIDSSHKFQKWAKATIESMIDQTLRKEERIKNDMKTIGQPKQNKIGKKSFVSIKPGKLAEFIAKDIMLFTPNDKANRRKLTGLNFRILQAEIAQYNGDFDQLRRLFVSAHIVNDANGGPDNPIIKGLLDSQPRIQNTNQLYQIYLRQRELFLKQCLNTKEYTSLYFLYPERSRWMERDADFYKALAGKYLHDDSVSSDFDKPLELPRGLFEKAIRETLATHSSLQTIANDSEKNISYLIYAYFKHIESDDCQDFYGFDRCHKLFNTLFKERPTDSSVFLELDDIYVRMNKNTANSFKNEIASKIQNTRLTYKEKGNKRITLEQKRKETEQKLNRQLSDMKSTETDIKRHKIQDMLLFLIAKSILIDKQANGNDKVRTQSYGSMKLKDLLQGNILEHKIPFKIEVKTFHGCTKSIAQSDMKIKDYARFYQFLNDRRVPTLLDITVPEEIDRKSLEDELENYDKVHTEVVKNSFALEKYIEESEPTVAASQTFNRKVYALENLEAEKKAQIIETRNSFSHLSYYEKSQEANKKDMPQKANTIANEYQKLILNATNH